MAKGYLLPWCCCISDLLSGQHSFAIKFHSKQMMMDLRMMGSSDVTGRVLEGILASEIRHAKPKPPEPRRTRPRSKARLPHLDLYFPLQLIYKIGDVLEGKLLGWDRYYGGKVRHDHPDYVSILFDDGSSAGPRGQDASTNTGLIPIDK